MPQSKPQSTPRRVRPTPAAASLGQPQPPASAQLRRCLRRGALGGTLWFIVTGIPLGIWYGQAGGSHFVAELYPLNQAGAQAAVLGMAVGCVLCLLSLWALNVIGGAAVGAGVYWLRQRSFPDPD
jgi:hypothetical protein